MAVQQALDLVRYVTVSYASGRFVPGERTGLRCLRRTLVVASKTILGQYCLYRTVELIYSCDRQHTS